jgi:hypothetical protein
MTLKFLTKAANGLTQLVSAIVASTGASDASKIIATNASGQIDKTFLPAAIGKSIVTTTAGVALSAGNFVYFDNTGKAFKADNTDITKAAMGFVAQSVALAATVDVYTTGVNSDLSGLTPGSIYYLGTAGSVVATAPTFTINTICQVLGYARSSTELVFEYNEPIQFANQ